MKLPRLTATVALTSVLALTACTGEDGSPDATSADAGATSTDAAATTVGADGEASTATSGAGSDGDAATATSDVATATSDAAGTTAGADDDDSTVAMSTDEATAVMSVEDAEEVATTVLEHRFDALRLNGRKAEAARKLAYFGRTRAALEAADQLEEVTGEAPESEAKAPAPPNVLAISRDDDTLPEYLLVQTVPDDGAPVLHLMQSRSGKDRDFRIVWEATMLPGTSLPTFDRRSVGTPVVRDGRDGLARNPVRSMEILAGSLDWPRADRADMRTNGYGPTVRTANREQSRELDGQASLSESNESDPEGLRTLLFEDGSGFIMGTLLRRTTFDVEPNTVLTAPDAVAVLSDRSRFEDKVRLRSTVFVGLRVPSDERRFQPEVIAVREQLIRASGR